MKKVFMFLLLSLFFFTSCSEESILVNPKILPPDPPTLIAPTDGETSVVVSPTLTWKVSETAYFYNLQVSASDSFLTFIFDLNVGNVTTKLIGGLSKGKKYYWRVNATNNNGTSYWSNVFNFTTGQTPGKPILSSPADNAKSIPNPPTLVWFYESGVTSYTLQVSTETNFASFAFNQDVGNDTSYQVTGLSDDVKYYWRVRASSIHGTSSYSYVNNFTMGQTPGTPALSSPVNGTINQSVPPTLRWNSSSHATSYTLQISTISNFGIYTLNQNVGNVLSKQVSGLTKEQIYYWRVVAANNNGTSTPSATWSFTTESVCNGITQLTYAGKTYNTVKIGKQCWLKENLNVGNYAASANTGSSHSDVSNNGVIEKYCYNNDPTNCNTFGGLYDWKEAMAYSTTPGAQGICPTGWHIPTLAEFEVLKGAVNNDGNALKAKGVGNGGGVGTNTSGFSALLLGYRTYNGNFGGIDTYSNFWSSTEYNAGNAYYMSLYFIDSNISYHYTNEESGFSVRCLKDD